MEDVRGATSVDVARLARVSQATVSMVFNGRAGRSRVSGATRERVLQAAATLGYSPHPLAQALRKGRSDIIAFVPRVHRTRPTEFPVPFQLSLHLARAALHHGYHVIEVGAEDDSVLADRALAPFLRSRRVDGVIFDGPDNAQAVEDVVACGLPVVQVIRPQLAVATAMITVDPVPGITAAIDHLVALGHRRIAFLGRGGPYPIDRARLEGFRAALAQHGITPAPPDVLLIANYAVEPAYREMRDLLARPPHPTAVFAAGDNMALGVLRALYDARLRVPDDVSLVSYDDVFAGDLYPPLASVVQPLTEVGERAIVLLTELLDTATRPAPQPSSLMLPTSFIARLSTGPPRGVEQHPVPLFDS